MEYEVKLPVDGHDEVRERLHAAGAVPAGSAGQEDTYFEHPCRDLAERDEAVRLRRVGDALELTFKGAKRGRGARQAAPGQNDDGAGDDPAETGDDPTGTTDGADHDPTGTGAARPIKARPELNVRLLDDPTEWLAAVGFRAAVRLRKHRERWLLGNTEVSLDHIDGLGHFVEIEALPEAPDGTAAVVAVQERLGLADVGSTLRSYLDLALEAGAAGVQAVD